MGLLLFKPEHVDMITSGRKTETRRLWKSPRVRVGRTYQAKTTLFGEPFAHLKILSLHQEKLSEITKEAVLAEGYNSMKDFMEVWMKIHNGVWNPNADVWVVKFQVDSK